MKHLIIFICAIFATFNIAKAQVTISTRDLMGTKWQTARQYDEQSKEYYEFTQGIEIWHREDGKTLQGRNLYHP